MKRTITGVGLRAIGHQNFEETPTLNRNVQRIVRLGQVALGEQPLSGHHSRTGTHLKTRGQDRVLRRLGADLTDILVEQVLKNSSTTLEAGGADIGQVVGYGRHLGLLCIQTRLRNPK